MALNLRLSKLLISGKIHQAPAKDVVGKWLKFQTDGCTVSKTETLHSDISGETYVNEETD